METARGILEQAHQAMARGAWSEALELFQDALAAQPDFGDALQGGAVALRRLGRREVALAWLDRAIAVSDDPAPALNTRGNVLLDLQRYAEALEAFDRALATRPGFTLAHLGRGYALMALERPAAALASFDEAGRLDPQSVPAHQWGGKASVQLGRMDAALARFERARGIRPDVDVDLDIANLCLREGRIDHAFAEIERVLAQDPEQPRARYLRALGRLAQGRYREGWADYEYRIEGAQIREVEPELAARCLRWPTVERLAGRSVLLVGGQGVGDVIMFASLIQELMAVAARVSLACDPRLHRLFGASFPGLRLLPKAFPKSEVEAHEVTTLLSSLCGVFRTTAGDFPGQAYLRPAAGAIERWKVRLADLEGMRLGVSWRGGHATTGGVLRSWPAAELAAALAAPGRQLISLQYGDVTADRAALDAAGLPVRFFAPQDIDDFDDLAGLISTLDAVVSVQTAVVHLCGALGVPCHVLLPRVPEWRYATHPSRMPWYGSVTLHRSGEDRGAALRAIAESLAGSGADPPREWR